MYSDFGIWITLIPYGSIDGHVAKRVDHCVPQNRILFRTERRLQTQSSNSAAVITLSAVYTTLQLAGLRHFYFPTHPQLDLVHTVARLLQMTRLQLVCLPSRTPPVLLGTSSSHTCNVQRASRLQKTPPHHLEMQLSNQPEYHTHTNSMMTNV